MFKLQRVGVFIEKAVPEAGFLFFEQGYKVRAVFENHKHGGNKNNEGADIVARGCKEYGEWNYSRGVADDHIVGYHSYYRGDCERHESVLPIYCEHNAYIRRVAFAAAESDIEREYMPDYTRDSRNDIGVFGLPECVTGNKYCRNAFA